MIGRGFQDRERAQDVALERLGRAAFQQRQVLERRGMEHDVGPEPLEDLPDPARVADVGQHGLLGIEQGPPVQRELDRVQGRLVAVQHDQLRGPELVQLAAELGADGAARAGHQDPLARDVLADRGHVGGHRPAPEQVADAGIPDALDLRAAGEQFPHRRDHLRDEPAALGRLGEVLDDLAGLPGDRDDQHPGPGAGGDLRHLAAAAEHRNAVDPQPPLGRVVIEDRHRPVGRVGLGGQPTDQLGPGVPRPEDDDLHGRRERAAGTAAGPRRRRTGRRASRPGPAAAPAMTVCGSGRADWTSASGRPAPGSTRPARPPASPP